MSALGPLPERVSGPGEVTNTIGAMQGWGSFTVALVSELPVVLAGNSAC
jgi:hypothetical protein